MNKTRQIDTVRKRNAELSKELDDLKFKLDYNSQLNMNGYQRAKDLIGELEKIKQDWLSVLIDLENKKNQYDELIKDLQKIKSIMTSMGFKIPWYKRLINKIKNK